MVQQHAAQLPPGRRPRDQRRVQVPELAVAGAGGGDHGQGPESPVSEVQAGPAALLGLGGTRKKSRHCLVGKAIVHEISARD